MPKETPVKSCCGNCYYAEFINNSDLGDCTWVEQNDIPQCVKTDLITADDGEDCSCWEPKDPAND